MNALQLPESRARRYALLALAPFFVLAGINHFRDPAFYLAMMPPYLPAHGLLVAVSGVLEIVGGVGVLVPGLRQRVGWGLAALLVGVFPANLHVALNPELLPGLSAAALWTRLPVQLLLIAWCLWATRVEQMRADQGVNA